MTRWVEYHRPSTGLNWMLEILPWPCLLGGRAYTRSSPSWSIRCATKGWSTNARVSLMRRLPLQKRGGDDVGLTKRGKGVKMRVIVDRHGLTLSVCTYAANHHEVTLVQL